MQPLKRERKREDKPKEKERKKKERNKQTTTTKMLELVCHDCEGGQCMQQFTF